MGWRVPGPAWLSSSAHLCLTARQILTQAGRAGSSYQRANPLKWRFKQEEALWQGKAEPSGRDSRHQWETWDCHDFFSVLEHSLSLFTH